MPPSINRRAAPSRRLRVGSAAVTLRDVARAANVAQSTVSRALAADPRISVATRRAVQQVARRLGYAPNAFARGLAGGGADVVAVVIPRTAEYTFASGFHLALLKGISRVLQDAGYLLLLSFLEKRDYVALHRSGLCRGVIVLMSRIGDRQVAALRRACRRCSSRVIPPCPALPRSTSMSPSRSRSRCAASWRSVTAASASSEARPDSLFHRDRLSAFERALGDAGVAADPALVAETNFTPAEAAERALALLTLAEPPTALVCSGDLIAQGALAAAQKLGLRVPADLSLVSLSALPGQRITAPGIAAVISDFEEAGATASRLLLDLIAGGPPPAAPTLLPTTFDPAGSLAPPARR
jgi:DNA-binding LacI/PurR family transcriptional regulator